MDLQHYFEALRGLGVGAVVESKVDEDHMPELVSGKPDTTPSVMADLAFRSKEDSTMSKAENLPIMTTSDRIYLLGDALAMVRTLKNQVYESEEEVEEVPLLKYDEEDDEEEDDEMLQEDDELVTPSLLDWFTAQTGGPDVIADSLNGVEILDPFGTHSKHGGAPYLLVFGLAMLLRLLSGW